MSGNTKKSFNNNIYQVSCNWQNSEIEDSSEQQQQQQHSLFSQASWGRLEMKPERNKFKVQAH